MCNEVKKVCTGLRCNLNDIGKISKDSFMHSASFCPLNSIFNIFLVNKEYNLTLDSKMFWNILALEYKIDLSDQERKEMDIKQLKCAVRRSVLLNILALGILKLYKRNIDHLFFLSFSDERVVDHSIRLESISKELEKTTCFLMENYSANSLIEKMEEFSSFVSRIDFLNLALELKRISCFENIVCLCEDKSEDSPTLNVREFVDALKEVESYSNIEIDEWDLKLLMSALNISAISGNGFYFDFFLNKFCSTKKIKCKCETYIYLSTIVASTKSISMVKIIMAALKKHAARKLFLYCIKGIIKAALKIDAEFCCSIIANVEPCDESHIIPFSISLGIFELCVKEGLYLIPQSLLREMPLDFRNLFPASSPRASNIPAVNFGTVQKHE